MPCRPPQMTLTRLVEACPNLAQLDLPKPGKENDLTAAALEEAHSEVQRRGASRTSPDTEPTRPVPPFGLHA